MNLLNCEAQGLKREASILAALWCCFGESCGCNGSQIERCCRELHVVSGYMGKPTIATARAPTAAIDPT